MMYFNFLKDYVADWQADNEDNINWEVAMHTFLRSSHLSVEEISKEESRLQSMGYTFPKMLKAFWTEVGCGYLCTTDSLDHALQDPKAAMDIYLHEGDWSTVKFSCDILASNELPFFRISALRYYTIGLEDGVNLGKIYYQGAEIAPDLVDFVTNLLHNPSYYIENISS